MAKHVERLDMAKPTSCGRKIQQLTQALSEVEDFHQLQVSLQTKEYVHFPLSPPLSHFLFQSKTLETRKTAIEMVK